MPPCAATGAVPGCSVRNASHDTPIAAIVASASFAAPCCVPGAVNGSMRRRMSSRRMNWCCRAASTCSAATAISAVASTSCVSFRTSNSVSFGGTRFGSFARPNQLTG